jgi:UPF0716 family protein affecting phage T7 exclusion
LARIGFVIVVAVVWITVSPELATRLVGLVTLAHAGVHLFSRKIPYGWSGREPSGYITGGLAVVLAVFLGLIGTLLILMPHVVVDIMEAPRQ